MEKLPFKKHALNQRDCCKTQGYECSRKNTKVRESVTEKQFRKRSSAKDEAVERVSDELPKNVRVIARDYECKKSRQSRKTGARSDDGLHASTTESTSDSLVQLPNQNLSG